MGCSLIIGTHRTDLAVVLEFNNVGVCTCVRCALQETVVLKKIPTYIEDIQKYTNKIYEQMPILKQRQEEAFDTELGFDAEAAKLTKFSEEMLTKVRNPFVPATLRHLHDSMAPYRCKVFLLQ